MELEKLIQERDSYANKILRLGIIIAVIFLLPAVLAIVLSNYFNLPVVYFLGGAFVLSWVAIGFLYRNIHRKVRELESRIHELQREQENNKL